MHDAVKEDSRVAKTKGSLRDALNSLLKYKRFGKVTVSAICEEAQVSRAAFYANFIDKYDLLKYWLLCVKRDSMLESGTYGQIEKTVNEFIYTNSKIIKNIMNDVDCETLSILSEFILSILDSAEKGGEGKEKRQSVVLSHLCAGGLLYYLLWQVKSNFPPDVAPMNRYVYRLIEGYWEWEPE